MTNDLTESPPNNVVKGPWPVKSGREVKLPDTDVIEMQQNIQFAEELTQSLMVQMIHTMSENGIDVSAKTFIRDMAMVISLVNGSIYRDMGMEHITQKFMEEYVDIHESDDDCYETEVDFETLSVLSKMVEDDDDPEVS
jgi:hypothetical protein|tara:strand:+ start:10 stop:426 length:417 start_codon:yes stop_codon:yes gene_type:complete